MAGKKPHNSDSHTNYLKDYFISVIGSPDPPWERGRVYTPNELPKIGIYGLIFKDFKEAPADTEKEYKSLTTNDVMHHLGISKPTCLKYFHEGRIHAVRAGRSWKVLKSELERFLKGGNGR